MCRARGRELLQAEEADGMSQQSQNEEVEVLPLNA